MSKKLPAFIITGCAAILLFDVLSPISSLIFKAAFLVASAGLWLGVLMVFWQRRTARLILLMLPLLAALPWLLPARPADTQALRSLYVRRLQSFEGTTYVWGGESHRGIDCSGLPRRALREALFFQGFQTLNGGLLREALKQWWFDASARAIQQGYRHLAEPLDTTPGPIRKLEPAALLPGDLAVTTSGIHMLVYMGKGQWIQADPGINAVVTMDAVSSPNAWFDQPVSLHRWTILAAGTKQVHPR